jgi:hypothetical protein
MQGFVRNFVRGQALAVTGFHAGFKGELHRFGEDKRRWRELAPTMSDRQDAFHHSKTTSTHPVATLIAEI